MPKQFENQDATKLGDKTVSDAAALKKINHLANEAAKKAATTEQRYDESHNIISK